MDALLLYVFYFWILTSFFSCFLHKRALSTFKKACIWFVFFMLQMMSVDFISFHLATFALNCILITILCRLLYVDSNRKIIFISTTGCTIGMLVEIITAFILQLFGYTIDNMSFIGALTSKLILLGVVHGISLFQHQKAHNAPSYLNWSLLLGMNISSIIIIHTLFLLNLETISPLCKTLTTLSIAMLVFVNIAFFILYEKLSASMDLYIETLIMAQQVSYYEELRLNKEAQYSSFRREKHNLKNQLLTIRSFTLNNQCGKATAFINELIDNKEFGLTPNTQYNNLVLDALLSAKSNLAYKHNIKYKCNISVPSQLPFSDTDICVLIGNALENAFDACCKEDSTFDKYITITIKYKTNCFYCHFENSFSHKLKPSPNTMFHSTKSDSFRHGYGFSSIKQIVDKYNGITSISSNF